MVNETVSTVIDQISRLEKLGFKQASTKVKELSVRKRKMAIAYEHYRFVRQEKIDAFNMKLKGKSGPFESYKRLDFVSIELYDNCPPPDVLDALEKAMERKCFDSFEVAHIVQVEDPIIFGRIQGCPDRFFIAQWDTDVAIEDLLGPNEG